MFWKWFSKHCKYINKIGLIIKWDDIFHINSLQVMGYNGAAPIVSLNLPGIGSMWEYLLFSFYALYIASCNKFGKKKKEYIYVIRYPAYGLQICNYWVYLLVNICIVCLIFWQTFMSHMAMPTISLTTSTKYSTHIIKKQ